MEKKQTIDPIALVHNVIKQENIAKARAAAQAEADKASGEEGTAIEFDESKVGSHIPAFRAGDNVIVNYRIIEGDKSRIQAFRGDVIQIKGHEGTRTFTVRKISNGVGVERIFPFDCPNVASVEVTKRGKVRRARLFYLRSMIGKKARIKELMRSEKGVKP
jgi:large subunit ribosomal protein L19